MDRFFQYVPHRAKQTHSIFVPETRNGRDRVYTSVEKNFIGVNVADAGD